MWNRFFLAVLLIFSFFGVPSVTFADPTFTTVHIESNNPVDSSYARAGDTIRITFNNDFENNGPIYTFNVFINNFMGAAQSVPGCNTMCVYEFVVPEVGDSDGIPYNLTDYNPGAGLFEFDIEAGVAGTFSGTTDGSTVTIDRTPAPITTITSPLNNAEVGETFSVTGTCTNGIPVVFSGTGFTPSTGSVACSGGTYTSQTFTTIGNVNFVAKQIGFIGNTTTVTRKFIAAEPDFETTKIWNFNNSNEYTYDNSKITVSSGTAQFQKPATSEASYWFKSEDNPFLSPSEPWEGNLVFEPSVIYEDGIFKMWYSGGGATCSLGYATSPDGRNWTKHSTNPILGIGSGNSNMGDIACRNNVIKHNGVYYLTVVDGYGLGGEEVVLLTSNNGINFSNPQVILRPSNLEFGIANTFVFIDDDGTWYLFYDYKTESAFIWETNVASGPNLYNLTKNPGNLRTGLFRNGMYGGKSVYKIGKQYHMWYHASTNGQPVPTKIFHSVSDDLITWRSLPDVVVDITQPSWETDQTADPFIVEANGKLYMYYDGDDNTDPGNVIAYIGFVEFDGTFDDFGKIQAQDITPVTSQIQDFDSIWGFSETATKSSNTEIYYQISINGGATWKYWNGSAWVSATGILGSTAVEVNDNIRSLANTGGGGTFLYKAFLYSEGGQIVLDDVSLSYSLLTAPVLTGARASGGGQIVLEWAAPSQSTAPITDYVIAYKKSSAATWSEFPHTPSSNGTIIVTGLEPGTLYDFKVAAINSQSTSDYSNILSATPDYHGAVVLPSMLGGGFTPPQPQTVAVPTVPVSPETPTIPVASGACSPYFVGSIRAGLADPALVRKLQEFLNTYEKETLAVDGVYGPQTMRAVIRFQEKYRTEILAPWGLSSGTGMVSLTTSAKMNALVCGQQLGCPHFTEYVKAGESKPEVTKIKSFLNTLDATLKLDTTSNADAAFVAAVSKFQLRYKDFILKPWGLSRPTGYWYKTTSAKANEFMGCVSPQE